MGARAARRARCGRRSGPTSGRASSSVLAHRRGHLGRGAAALPRAQRLRRGDLPHVLLQPADRRRRRGSPACCAWSARTPSGSSASGGWPPLRDLGSDADGAAQRGRGARAAAAGTSPATALAAVHRSPTCFDDDGDGRASRCASRHRRPGTPAAPALIAPGDRDAAWPVASVPRAGRCWSTTSPTRFGDAADRRLARAADRRPCVVPLRQQGSTRPFGVPRRGAQPLPAARRRLPRLPRAASPARSPPASRSARAYEAERRRAEQLAELDRAKTDVLHQRQPRVPHAADAAARPGRGRARRRRAPAGRRRSAQRVELRPAQRPAAAQAGQHPARLLPARVRPGDAQLRAGRPRAYTAELASMFAVARPSGPG